WTTQAAKGTLMPSGWVYVCPSPDWRHHVWIHSSGWCLSGSDRVAGDLCPYGLYPQDERNDPPFGTNRGQHTQIKQPWQVRRSQEACFFLAPLLLLLAGSPESCFL